MAWSGTVQIHGVPGTGYPDNPAIYATVSIGDVVRDGDRISCSVSASLDGLGGYDSFGYNIDLGAQLDNGDIQVLLSKPNYPNQWNSGEYTGAQTVSSVNTGTICTVKIVFRSICGSVVGGCASSPHFDVVWSTALDAPAADVIVTFDLDGGTRTGGGELTQTVAIGGSATAPICTRANCVFVRWDKPLTNITSATTITAIWDYIIHYDTSELYYITLPDQLKHKNETLVLDSTNLSSENPGHEHTGWATSRGGAPAYSLGGNYTTNAPMTLYPAWDISKTTFTVKFDLRGGSSSGGGALIQTIRYGQSATPPNNPTKSGKRFMGWLGDYTNITSDRTIYAMWDASPLWIFTGSEWVPFAN